MNSNSKTGEVPWYQTVDKNHPTIRSLLKPREPSMSEHDADQIRIDSLEQKVTDLGEAIAGLHQRLDGLPGESAIESRIDVLAGSLTDLVAAHAAQREEVLKLVEGVFVILEPLKKLHVAAASAQRLEKFFAPLLKTTDELKSDEVANKAYVDGACVKVSQALREHTRRTIDGTLQAMQRALDTPTSSRKVAPKKTKATAAGKRGRLAVSTRRR